MKNISDIIVEFSSVENDEKLPYLESLSDEELRTFLPHIGWYRYYKEFIESLLSKRVLEKRNNKLDNLGI